MTERPGGPCDVDQSSGEAGTGTCIRGALAPFASPAELPNRGQSVDVAVAAPYPSPL